MIKKEVGKMSLPVKNKLGVLYFLSILIALLMAVASAMGLIYGKRIYLLDEDLESYISSDIIILFIVLPFLLGSLFLAFRGKLLGLLLWPGVLLFVIYNYFVYIYILPLNYYLLISMIIVVLSLYALVGVMVSINGEIVKKQLLNTVPRRTVGVFLVILGIFFFSLTIVTWWNMISDQTPLSKPEFTRFVFLFLISPCWIIGGVQLWRQKEFGYVVGLGFLFQISMLFSTMITFFLVLFFLFDWPFHSNSLLGAFLMGTVSFIPFILFVRSVVLSHDPRN